MRAGLLGGARPPASGSGSAACGRCSRRRCRRRAPRPAAGSRCSCRARRARSARAPRRRAAPRRRPGRQMPVEGAGERRLAGGRGADDPERLAGLEREVERRAGSALLLLGRHHGELADLELRRAGGAGRSASPAPAWSCEQRLEARPALPGARAPAASRRSPARPAPAPGRAGSSRRSSRRRSSRPGAPRRRRGRASPTAGRSGRSWSCVENWLTRSPEASWASSARVAQLAASGRARRRACRGAWTISPCWRMVSAKASPCIVAPVASRLVRLVSIWLSDGDARRGAACRRPRGGRVAGGSCRSRRGRAAPRACRRRAKSTGEPVSFCTASRSLRPDGRLRALAREHRAAEARPRRPGRRAAVWTVAPIRAATRPRT